MVRERSDEEEKVEMNKELNTVSHKENVEQTKTSTGLDENVAGLLCYLVGAITGIVFIIMEKENKFIRFHAIQSIITSVVIIVANVVLAAIPLIGWLISLLLAPLILVLWIILMYKAYQGHTFKLPIIGDFAEKQLEQMKA